MLSGDHVLSLTLLILHTFTKPFKEWREIWNKYNILGSGQTQLRAHAAMSYNSLRHARVTAFGGCQYFSSVISTQVGRDIRILWLVSNVDSTQFCGILHNGIPIVNSINGPQGMFNTGRRDKVCAKNYDI